MYPVLGVLAYTRAIFSIISSFVGVIWSPIYRGLVRERVTGQTPLQRKKEKKVARLVKKMRARDLHVRMLRNRGSQQERHPNLDDTPSAENEVVEPTPYTQQYPGLIITAFCRLGENEMAELRLLVDTGSECNVLKPWVVPRSMTRPLPEAQNMRGLDGRPIRGGENETLLTLRLRGSTLRSNFSVRTQASCILADFAGENIDGILGYPWLARRKLMVDPETNSLVVKGVGVIPF